MNSDASGWVTPSLLMRDRFSALSIRGRAGIGKKLLVQGLAETINTGKLANADDIVGDHGYGLLDSPYLNVFDEGWLCESICKPSCRQI